MSRYFYDANGNRLSHWTLSSTDSGAYDAQDRMLAYANALYTYTRNGDLRTKVIGTDTTRYSYDNLGNLREVTMPNGDRIEYVIDGQNRRIAKIVNGTVVKRWIYAGELTPVAELDSAGNVVSRFAGGYFIKGGATYRLITDHLGSIRMVVNASTGVIVQRLEYDEFGNVIYDGNPDFQPFGYAGGLYDTRTGLVRFGARDYDASAGRWTSKDPIGFGGGENLFAYVGNDPLNFFDETGLKCPPKSPQNVDIEKNIAEAKKHALLPLMLDGSLAENLAILAENISNLLWFKNKVESSGDWDYKKEGKEYAEYGNFHYGVVSETMNINDEVLLRAIEKKIIIVAITSIRRDLLLADGMVSVIIMVLTGCFSMNWSRLYRA